MASATLDPTVDDALDVEILERAYRASTPADRRAPRAVKGAQLTITRNTPHDFQDRQVFVFVDGEPWGKVRYGQPMTREIAPGTHEVRVNNTLLSDRLQFHAVAGEHVRLRCYNGMPRAGWLMMIFLHVTYLLVKIERDT
jgi:hypothetical protein